MKPTQDDIGKAARIWCEPRHQHRMMDVDLAYSIAQVIADARQELLERFRKMAKHLGVHNGH